MRHMLRGFPCQEMQTELPLSLHKIFREEEQRVTRPAAACRGDRWNTFLEPMEHVAPARESRISVRIIVWCRITPYFSVLVIKH